MVALIVEITEVFIENLTGFSDNFTVDSIVNSNIQK